LNEPEITEAAQAMFDEDMAEMGFVMNASRLWAYQPATCDRLFELMSEAVRASELSFRHRGLLVTATASTLGDSYCSLAWGYKLAAANSGDAAAAVLRGDDTGLTAAEQTMVTWARKVVRDPNATTEGDVQSLRSAGFSDGQIFAITTFVGLRLAFSTINDALGARPDTELFSVAPADVVNAVTYGRCAVARRSDGDPAERDGDSGGGGKEQAAGDAAPGWDQPEQRTGQDGDLPQVGEVESERDRGAGDRADDRGTGAAEEGLDRVVGADPVEAASTE
jgi:uncharacterized peroxidase-related enzyme